MHIPSFRIFATACILSVSTTLLCVPGAHASPYKDSDGDGLTDYVETHGYDANGDGIIDLDLPKMGANPYKKDLFIEMDYMPGLEPSQNVLDRITETFASYPIRNPDGTLGISIHLDATQKAGSKYNLGGANEIPYNPLVNGINDVSEIRSTNADPNRDSIFHYMIWGDKYGQGSSSGFAYVNGTEFAVTVGPTHWGKASDNVKVGSFMHELGHNLGLRHGGNDDVNNKPNYFSVMNYSYQLTGIRKANGKRYYGYSTRTLPTLDENNLNEAKGFGPGALGFLYKGQTANNFVDYNDNQTIDSGIAKDLNGDSTLGLLTAPNDLSLIHFQVHSGVAAGISLYDSEVEENEMTAEAARSLNIIP